jgi:Family of unknown function (DUF6929)
VLNLGPLFPAMALLCLVSCSENKSASPLRIAKIQVLDRIPSGSGIVIKEDTGYIVGDDATGLYLLNLRNYQQQKIPIATLNQDLYREPKSIKRDFECATFIDWKGKEYLLAFGSGSTPLRDSLLMIHTTEFTDCRIFSLHYFYEGLRKQTQTKIEAWNIEGVTTELDTLYLFNRGDNRIMNFKISEFMQFLMDAGSPFPTITHHSIRLPFIQNHEARLSGACTLDSHHLLFSASVEDTREWSKDGPVLGIFIGIYSLLQNTLTACYLAQDKSGAPLKEKIESLSIVRNSPGEDLELLAVGDNDNGTTNLFHLILDKSVLKKLP